MDAKLSGDNHGAVRGQNSDFDNQMALSSRGMKLNHLFGELSDGARQDLVNYLDVAGLATEAGILVIPYGRHYFYDADEIKRVKTMVNLKQLNYVREIRDFLHKVAEMLPFSSNFVGCFIDNSSQNGFSDKYGNLPRHVSEKAEAYENGIESRIPFINRMYSFIDAKTNRYLTKKTVARLLDECGMQLVGMTEVNGLTYFHSRKRTARMGLIA
jgi:hypothetical protein